MFNRRQFLITTAAALAAAGLIAPSLKAKPTRRTGEAVLYDQDGDPFYFVKLEVHGGYRCSLGAKDKWPKFPLIADSQEDINQFSRYGLIIEQPNVQGWGHRKSVFQGNFAFLKDSLPSMEM